MVTPQGDSVHYVCTKFEADCSISSKVIRGSQISPRCRFSSRGRGMAKIYSAWDGDYLYLQTQFGEDRYTQFRVIVVTDPPTHTHTNPQTGPLTIHCAAKLSAQCNHSHSASELVKLHLMDSYCYPVLLYAIECFNLPNSCIRQLNSRWNSVYRRFLILSRGNLCENWKVV